MKKTTFLVLIFFLIVFQLFLLEALVPYYWPHPIDELWRRIFPLPPYDPHPSMAWEFELDFRDHPSHRILADAMLALLSLGNVCLIILAVRQIGRLKKPLPG